MLNLNNKILTKIIVLVLMQSFLFTAVIFPESINNKDIAAIYKIDTSLRVPMGFSNIKPKADDPESDADSLSKRMMKVVHVAPFFRNQQGELIQEISLNTIIKKIDELLKNQQGESLEETPLETIIDGIDELMGYLGFSETSEQRNKIDETLLKIAKAYPETVEYIIEKLSEEPLPGEGDFWWPGYRESTTSKIVDAFSRQIIIDRIGELMSSIKPSATSDTIDDSIKKLSRIAKTYSEEEMIVRCIIEGLLSSPNSSSVINSAINTIVKYYPNITKQVIDIIMEEIGSETNPSRLADLREALYLDGIVKNDPKWSNYVQWLERAYKINKGMKEMIKNKYLQQNLKLSLMEKMSIIMNFRSTSKGPEIVALLALFKEGLLTDDDLEGRMLHEVLHAERADDKTWPSLTEKYNNGEEIEKKDAENTVRLIEFEVDKLTVERLIEYGRDPRIYVEGLKNNDAVHMRLEKEGYLVAPSGNRKRIPTPSIEDRVRMLEDFLKEHSALQQLIPSSAPAVQQSL